MGALGGLNVRDEVLEAAERISGYVRETPLESSHVLGQAGNCEAFLKLENFQLTGSFKVRGAMNKLLSLEPEVRARGVVAASTGNHGAAVACGAAQLGCPALIFAPENAVVSKLDTIRAYGATIRQVGDDCLVSEAAARELADAEGWAYVSPYNDPLVVAGQGTIGLEIERELPDVDAVFVSVGGGGLVAGIGGYLRNDVKIFGVSPANSCVMHASLAAGRLLDLPSDPTLSDGTAGGVEAGSITFELCRAVIDEFLLVSEDEIAKALALLTGRHHMLVEGAAAAAAAGFLQYAPRLAGKKVAVVLCGANIDIAVLKGVL